jgi:hypothetical protein
MNMSDIKKRYHPEVVEHMLEVLFDTPVDQLVEELLYNMTEETLDNWAKVIQADNSYSDEVNHES